MILIWSFLFNHLNDLQKTKLETHRNACDIKLKVNVGIKYNYVISFLIIAVCAEYNEGGNLVQENHFTDCSGYDSPCPNRYPSTNAYKCR